MIPSKDELWFGDDIDEKTFREVYKVESPAAKEQEQLKAQMVQEMNAVTGDKAK